LSSGWLLLRGTELPAKTNTDRINDLSEAIAVLTERLDNFAADLAEVKTSIRENASSSWRSN
jgi:C4-dicarboxylate-specific signal transduction histidine kinase